MTSSEWHETVDHTICTGDQRIVARILDDLAACEKERDEQATDFIERIQKAEARVKVLEEERATHARVIESWKREEEGWREREKMMVEALGKLRRTHLDVDEDCWYSCPKAGHYCGDGRTDICDCGADEANAIIDAALGKKVEK